MKQILRYRVEILISLALGLSLACNLPGFAWQVSEKDRVSQTVVALSTLQEATRLARSTVTPAPPPATKPSLPSPTVEALPEMTDIPTGYEPLPEHWRRAARILVFENMSASRYYRYVRDALDWAGYFYVDVGSAKGWFQTQLTNSVEWDLIIAAVENQRDYRGSMGSLFQYLDDRIEQGAASIVEFGDFDYAPDGASSVLLRRCGVELQSDWAEPNLRTFTWLVPDHPVLVQPNQIAARLSRPSPLTRGEIGDLLRLAGEGGESGENTLLLAGLDSHTPSESGVLATCLGGRMILQTFPSHDYPREAMVALWQNYIYQTLKKRFSEHPPGVPAPEANLLTTDAPVNTEASLVPCSTLLTGKLLQPPRYRVDLFEHHAQGTFVVLSIELMNLTRGFLQIWDDDIRLEALINGQPVSLGIDKPATGYLYIDQYTDLWQELVEPGQAWRPRLAFDIPADQKVRWELVIRPGLEFNTPSCELRIPVAP